MSLQDLVPLILVEIVGDTGFKYFANEGGLANFAIGAVGYVGVVYQLIRSLQGSNLMVVNTARNGISTLMENGFAFLVMGERYEDAIQYLGLLLIVIGLFCLQLPVTRAKDFKFPKLNL